MKMPEAISIAVNTNNAKMAGSIADQLRFKCGMNYSQIFDFANKHTGISKDNWETLMEDSESASED